MLDLKVIRVSRVLLEPLVIKVSKVLKVFREHRASKVLKVFRVLLEQQQVEQLVLIMTMT